MFKRKLSNSLNQIYPIRRMGYMVWTEDYKFKLPGHSSDDKFWKKYNTIVYPPTEKGHIERPAEYCHSSINIKYSPKKMFYPAALIRGMSIEEAVKQLKFQKNKGATLISNILLEAQGIAVKDHYFEYKSLMWIGL
ncbi:39S ribosomal protein L22, mitochondrial [Intoshia linei]|uniref:Large ribosomal subunit protein uL22m n=1 Tax=Intoshia linei TaxID=1819745 RepID=A0A177AVN0_9BILA|nr:39S ribosomal protein L22, mitochondrial [Intoshia linei]